MTAPRPVALITGGHRGIGLGIATALARSGFDIAVVDIASPKEAQEAIGVLRSHGAEAVYVQEDISDVAAHQAAIAEVTARFGRVACLVNNAGIASPVRGGFLDLKPENFDRVVAVNLRGTVFMTQAVIKAMIEQETGGHPRSIINITSASAALSSPERLDYCISKAGLSAFSQGLALAFAEAGIAVFEVRPGIIRSDMTAAVSKRYDTLISSGVVPMRRWGEPRDIGDIVAALASGAFGFATGSVIDADGGLSISRL
jgi:NAD(P)-dependent dehydrogenase (short-subunit alcohol dehydrogenase family)